MAEETIYCPSCNHKLRVPEEMLGQTVQCPLCRVVFVAPTRGGVPAPPQVLPAPTAPAPPVLLTVARTGGPGEESPPPEVEAKLRPPALALLFTGAFGWIVNTMVLLVLHSLGPDGMRRYLQNNLPPGPGRDDVLKGMASLMTEAGIHEKMFYSFLSLLLCTGIVIGAVHMLYRRRHGLAVLGCVLAMVNINECCCVLGLPIGIWALSVLLRPEVRRAFEA